MTIIKQTNMIEEMEQSFLDYAVAVITDRALPSVKDGLKPVHRRILYAMHGLGLTPNKPYKKSARIVGDTMGKYHPHGDSAIYEAMVRLSQEWKMRYPLVDGQGNFGSVDGDGAAASRYTEARMSKMSQDMLYDIKKETVDMKLTFSEDDYEPVVLPARVPNLLINGASGIAVGMACSFAPHNLGEIVDAIVAYLNDNDITVKDLMSYVQGPDFPTGGIVINKDELAQAYLTGNGRARIRGKYHIETKKGKDTLVFTEIPYGVSKETLIASIAELCEEKKIEGITDILDETNREGMRISIQLKKGTHGDVIANQLFKLTRLEDTFSYNQVCLIDEKTPALLNFKELIEHYAAHQIDVLVRKCQFELRKIKAQLHILNGLLIALEDIDNVIALIKASSSSSDAVDGLIEKYEIDEIQAKAIIDMRLKKLTGLEKIELMNERDLLVKESERLNTILVNPSRQKEEVIKDLDEMKKQYSDDRRTTVMNMAVAKEEKEIEYVMPEDVVVVLTQNGEIKRIPAKSYKSQNRNGKGVKNQEQESMNVIRTNTTDTLMIFTALGKCFRMLVDNVPSGTNASRGTSIHTLVNMEAHDKIMAITSLYRKSKAEYVVIMTKDGMIKKTKVSEFVGTGKRVKAGTNAIKLREDDSIVEVSFLNEEQIIVFTKNGMSLRMETKDITPIGKVAIGVKAVSLVADDEVLTFLPVNKLTDEVALFTSNGLGRRSKIENYPLQKRGGRGTIASKLALVGALMVDDTDNILVVGNNTSICIESTSIPTLGKGASGNTMIKDNNIVSVLKLKR